VFGALSYYSNAGPLRTPSGTVKPDITAPGQFYAAPAASGASNLTLDNSGKYRLFNGTSAACPYTAGVAALLLQRKPTLTADGFRQLLKSNATQDAKLTGKCPNERWGFGKLDVAAINKMIAALRN
jgi:bacillopeptidase F